MVLTYSRQRQLNPSIRLSVSDLAVKNNAGMGLPRKSARNSIPVSPGIITSTTRISNAMPLKFSVPHLRLPHRYWKPLSSRKRNKIRSRSSSSITRMRCSVMWAFTKGCQVSDWWHLLFHLIQRILVHQTSQYPLKPSTASAPASR